MSRIVPRVVRPARVLSPSATRSVTRRPQSYLLHSHNPPVRSMSSLVPRWPHSEFSSLFRLLDDYSDHVMQRGSDQFGRLTAFTPRFDIRETDDAYHLDGELPGLSQQNIEIEFTDPQTLVIKGRTERSYSSGTPPTEATVNTTSTSAENSGEAAATGTQSTSPATTDSTTGVPEKTDESTDSSNGRYWVTERSYGEFSRTFSFPSRVDQDGVKANLKNGILSIVVPKAAAPAGKRITIE